MLGFQPKVTIESLVFLDSKRPITTDVLRRISLVALAHRLGRLEDLTPYLEQSEAYKNAGQIQLQLVMERRKNYFTS